MTSRPPREAIESFRDRKWKEGLVRATGDSASLVNVPFVTVGNSEVTSNERALTGSSNVTVQDGGAGGGVVLDLSNSGVTAGTYQRATVTVDSKGRVTSASSGSNTPILTQYDNTDPASPLPGEMWLKRTYSASGGGTANGHFGHTDSGSISDSYQLSVRTTEGTTKRVTVS